MGDAVPVPVITLEPSADAAVPEGAPPEGAADPPRSSSGTALRRTKKPHHHHRRDDEDPRGIVVREPSAPPPQQQQQPQSQPQQHHRSKSTDDRSKAPADASGPASPENGENDNDDEEEGQHASSKSSKCREKRCKPRSLSLAAEPELPRAAADAALAGDETPAEPLTPGQTRTAERRRRLTRAARMSPSEIRTVMLSISADDIPALARPSPTPGDDSPRQQPQQQQQHRTRRAASAAAEIPSTAAGPPSPAEEDAAAALSPPHRLADVSRQQQQQGDEDENSDEEEEEETRRGKHGADEGKGKGRLGRARFFSLNVLRPLKTGSSSSSSAATPRTVRSPLLSPLFGAAPAPRRPAAVVDEQNARVFTMTLDEVVRAPDLCAQFYEYLQRLNASEGLEFLVRLESLRAHEAEPGASPARLHRRALAMVRRFICEGAELELNLSSATRDAIVARLTEPGADTLLAPSEVFQEARVEVLNMLGSTLYAQWIASLH